MKTRIRELRIEYKLTQETLAYRIGASQAVISKIENGVCMPDATLLIHLSGFFNVSTDYILYLSDHRLTADILLSNNFHNLKMYQSYISILQKLKPNQRTHLYHLLESIYTSI